MREEVGKFLLTLYRGSQEQPIESFRQWTLERLLQIVPFDWAYWRYGTIEKDVCWLHITLPYRRSHSLDGTLEPINALPRRTTAGRPKQHLSVMRVVSADIARRKPINNSDSEEAAKDDQDSLPYIVICLYLDNPVAVFSDEESRSAAILGPHLIEAWIHKLFLHLQNQPMPFKSSCERALCDIEGVLWCAPPNFGELLREEWPQWHGRMLPAELIKAIKSHDKNRIYDGNRIRCMASDGPAVDLVNLYVQILPPLHILPPRQRKIALELAQGKTYNQIAHSLGISRSTVTNHANAIYSKLGISNKVQLAIICFGHSLQALIM